MTTRKEKIYPTGYVYRLVDTNTNETFYVGSTSQRLSARMCAHRSCALTPACKQYGFKVYEKMRNIGVENVRIVLIDEHHQITKLELEKLEQIAIEEQHARLSSSPESNDGRATGLMNRRRAYTTDAQRHEGMKEWRTANADKHRCALCHYGTYNSVNYRQHLAGKTHALADALRRLAEAEAALAEAREMTDDRTESAESAATTG